MKIIIATLLTAFFIFTPNADAQSKHPAKHRHKHAVVQSDTMSYSSSTTPETSMNPGAMPGDPYNLNHPFFNGEARWTNADSLYTHGDFPWALVQQHPESFRFDPATGKWEIVSTGDLGTMGHTR